MRETRVAVFMKVAGRRGGWLKYDGFAVGTNATFLHQ